MKKRLLALMLTGALGTTLLAGCGTDKTEPETNNGGTESAGEVNYDPMGKYDEPVKITGILGYSPAGEEYPSDTAPDNFGYLTQAKEQLNIDFEWLWTVPTAQFDQKFGVAMASGEIPDVMNVSKVDYEMLKENGQLQPLNEALKYMGEDFKKFLYKDPSVIESVTDEDGNIWAIPQYWDPRRSLNMTLIRKDWLDQLGLEIPKTAEELAACAKAFMDNGLAETGLALTKSFEGNYSLSNYLASFGSYPYKWINDGTGKLVAGETVPETKEALAFMNKLYNEGLIAKDFASLESKQVSEAIVASKSGILYGPWWFFDATLRDNKVKDQKAEWIAAPIADGNGKGKAILDRNTISEYFVISKDCKNPEAVIKLFNLDLSGEMYGEKWSTAEEKYVWHWIPTKYYDPYDIDNFYDKMNKQVETDVNAENPEGFTPDELLHWQNVKEYYGKYKTGELTEFKKEYGRAMSRAGIGWGSTKEIASEPKNVAYNEFYGAATPGMVQYQATLKKLTEETFIKIVMGELPVDAFDKYVEDWKNLGGEKITEEVNEWYKSVK